GGRHTSFSRDWSSDVCSSDLALSTVFSGSTAATTRGSIVSDVTASGSVLISASLVFGSSQANGIGSSFISATVASSITVVSAVTDRKSVGEGKYRGRGGCRIR